MRFFSFGYCTLQGIYFVQHFILYHNNNGTFIDTEQEERDFFYNRLEDSTDENGEEILTEFV